eukprot:scpid91673/ scgid29444/ 
MRLGVVVALLQVIFCTQLLLVEICNGELTDAKYAEHLRNVLESADEYDVEDKILSHTSDDNMDDSVEDDGFQALSAAIVEAARRRLTEDDHDADFGEKKEDETELLITRDGHDEEEDIHQGEESYSNRMRSRKRESPGNQWLFQGRRRSSAPRRRRSYGHVFSAFKRIRGR